MEFTNWKNQYIDLLKTKPFYIGSVRTPHDLPLVKETLIARAKEFKEIFVEIGSGSGGHLIDQAARNPTGFYVGFELRFKRVFRTAEKAEAAGIKNLFVLQCDASKLPELFESNALSGIFINFPDPWDKKRWLKHRLLNERFIEVLTRSLKVGGFIAYKSDHLEYFSETLTLFKRVPELEVQRTTFDLYASEYLDNNIASEFERLFVSQGLKINMLFAKKLADNSSRCII